MLQTKRFLSIVILTIFYSMASNSTPALGMHLGVGYGSPTSGRQIPALNLGFNIDKTLFSGMTGGIQTDVYYQSYYNLNILFGFDKWGTSFLGDVYSGFGLGVLYGEKSLIYESASAQSKDQDLGYGPAFRIEVRPFGGIFYTAIEFTMGWGISALLGGFADYGSLTIGARI